MNRTAHGIIGVGIVAGALLGACTAVPERTDGQQRPQWVDQPAEVYDPGLYVTGLGQAESAAVARDRARADLAKAFEVAVRAESLDVEEYARAGPVGDGSERLDVRIEREVRTRTDIVLQAVDIGESWQDPDDGIHYALATVARQRAANRLRDEIRQLDRTTDLHIDEAAAADDALRRLRSLDRAIDARIGRTALQRQLRVVDAGGRGIDPPAPLAELLAQYRRTADGLGLAVRTEGVAGREMARSLTGALADAGFRHVDADADHVLVAGLELDDLGRRSDWYWYRGYVRLEVRDPDGAVRASDRWTVKASATDRATARRRAIEKAAERVGEGFHGTLMQSGG